MFSMITDPELATQIARQQVDERIRDAEARRTARDVRRAAGAQSSMSQPRRTWRIRAIRRAASRKDTSMTRIADNDPRRPTRASATTARTLTSEGT